MVARNRREFLSDVGRGMMVAGVGAGLAGDLGFSPAFADQGNEHLDFGVLEPLADLLQQTPVENLLPLLVGKLKAGQTDLRQLAAAAALANARAFGGEDYVGFHTEMALLPAFQMTSELHGSMRPLPILKVLYRNTDQLQKQGGAKLETLKPVAPATLSSGADPGKLMLEAERKLDKEGAERIFAATLQGPIDDAALARAYNHLQLIADDDADVHRIVLAHRARALVGLVGMEHAHTMLRQCVRYCVNVEQGRCDHKRPEPKIRALLPKLLDQYKLAGRTPGKRQPDDAWVDRMSTTIFEATGEQAAEAVAGALADGMAPEAVGEAISLAANQTILCQASDGRGGNRTHGDSAGLHAADAMNAWRNIARVTDPQSVIASMIVGAYYVARNKSYGYVAAEQPYPLPEHRKAITTDDPKKLLAEAADAIRANDQGRAGAAIAIWGEKGYSVRPVLDLMLRFAISEDGRLHAEKYYRTVVEEFETTRPAFRWRHLTSLARVTASAYGYDRQDQHGHRAPGYEEACRLLGVKDA